MRRADALVNRFAKQPTVMPALVAGIHVFLYCRK
jgi:hypothetical protein